MKKFTDSSSLTDNATIDSTEMYDSSAELIGYVSTTYPKTLAKNGIYVKRIIINNAQGRTVQLIAWANNTRILSKFEAGEAFLCIERVYSNPAKPNSLYDGGNVRFGLVVNEKCNINILGTFDEKLAEEVSATVDFDTITNVIGPISQYVQVTSSLQQRENAPPYIRVETVSDIQLDETKNKESLCFLLAGYQYVE
ncbi:hypothetical protein QAD02_008138 [Eretmocerus hayati]|uniref:Uncharacterized protein n=1 Tax=Eretmocerus hayati TaxID=131215 RepID=A0ACC2N704_9HYME|nr:hypothetical protein QAD02_008138 [Eretmocerus hayati]